MVTPTTVTPLPYLNDRIEQRIDARARLRAVVRETLRVITVILCYRTLLSTVLYRTSMLVIELSNSDSRVANSVASTLLVSCTLSSLNVARRDAYASAIARREDDGMIPTGEVCIIEG